METRLRLILVSGGLPAPEVQYPVLDDIRRRAVWLDLAYPDHMLGIEYEGDEHTEPDRVLRDIRRSTRLVDQGWRLYRYTKHEIYREPERIVAEVRRGLRRRVPGTSATWWLPAEPKSTTTSRWSSAQPARTTLPSSAAEASSG